VCYRYLGRLIARTVGCGDHHLWQVPEEGSSYSTTCTCSCYSELVLRSALSHGRLSLPSIFGRNCRPDRASRLRPLLTLHGFRFIGLSFLVPGVVSADLPTAFARDAAYGDVVAAILALLALAALRSKLGIVLAWVFNIWGTLDLLNAFYVANGTGLLAGQLGAAFFIPTAIVPLLLITHGLIFRILLKHDGPTG